MVYKSEESKKRKIDPTDPLYQKLPLQKHISHYYKSGRKTTYFNRAKNWIKTNWDMQLPVNEKIDELLIDALRNKILGMNSISMYLISPDSRRDVIIPPRQYRRNASYEKLRIIERTQALKFWRRVKIYANRRNIPYTKRIYGGKKYTKIDVLNYRINTVGNRLKIQTMKKFGKGYNFFDDVQVIHNIPSLDIAETVRPLLYFTVLRSLLLPMKIVLPIIDEIIADGMKWVENRIELICNQPVDKFRINYHGYCKIINERINNIEIQDIGPHTKHKVTEFREPGVINFIVPTKETKAGEKIHRLLLAEFAQPYFLNVNNIFNSDYMHILAEVPISNPMKSIQGKIDLMIVNSRLEVLYLADIKTHETDDVELADEQKFQVNSYSRLLQENGFITDYTIKSIIHVHRGNIPNSIKPVIDLVMNNWDLLLAELKSYDLRGCIDPTTPNSEISEGDQKTESRPSLKGTGCNILTSIDININCMKNTTLSLWR